MSNFNTLATIYDPLVKVVFQTKLWEAQKYHLSQIKREDQVLILGGGTGKILEWVDCQNITYLDKSPRMIELARKRGQADFLCDDFLHAPIDQEFDWIVCPFFLDCFNEQNLIKAVRKIESNLKTSGKLLVIDFDRSPGYGLLVWMMIAFFKLAARLEACKLEPIRDLVSTSFVPVEQKSFSNGLIFSDIYGKR